MKTLLLILSVTASIQTLAQSKCDLVKATKQALAAEIKSIPSREKNATLRAGTAVKIKISNTQSAAIGGLITYTETSSSLNKNVEFNYSHNLYQIIDVDADFDCAPVVISEGQLVK